MTEEKGRRSKTYSNKKIGVCTKSVKFPIVLLQRLYVGAQGDILARETITNEIEVKTTQPSKKHELRNSSNITINLENDNTNKHKLKTKQTSDLISSEQVVQSTHPTETETVLQSTVTDTAKGIALSTTKSYKFKKKLKHLENIQLNDQIKTRSRNKLDDKKSVITDEKLNEKITDDSKLDNATAAKKIDMNSAVTKRKKVSGKRKREEHEKSIMQKNLEDHNLHEEQNGQEVFGNEDVFNISDLLINTSTTEETQIEISTSTRNRLLRKTEVDVPVGFNVESPSQNSSTPLPEKELCQSLETSEKLVPVNEIIGLNDIKNSIRTRSKVHEATNLDKSDNSVFKSTPKTLNYKPLLKKKVLEHEVKETNSLDAQHNSNIESSILTRSRLSSMKQQDHDKSNLSGIQTTNINNTSTVDESLTRQSTIENRNKDLVQAISSSNSSCIKISNSSYSPEDPATTANVNADSLAINENKIVKHKVTTRGKLLQNKNPNGNENDTVEGKVVQPGEDNFTINLSEIQRDNESSIGKNVFDQSMSLTYLKKTKEMINEEKRTTRSKILDKKNTAGSQKIIEIGSLQLESEKAQSTITGKKISRKSRNTPKLSVEALKTTDNGLKNVISTRRNRLVEKTKINDNKTIEESRVDVTIVQSKQNQSEPIANEIEISNKVPSSEKLLHTPKRLSTRTPKKLDTPSTVPTRRKAKKEKIDNHEKSVETETISSKQNLSLPEPEPMETNQQSITNDVQDGSKLLTDVSNAKESNSTGSKSLEETMKTDHVKSNVENEISQAKQTGIPINSESLPIESPVDSQNQSTDSTKAVENMDIDNTISTRSKTLENNKLDNRGSDDFDNISHLEGDNFTSNAADADVSTKSFESEKLPSSPKRNTHSVKNLKKIPLSRKISTRSKLLEKSESENRGECIIENEEKIQYTSNSSQVQNTLHETAVNIDDSGRMISTRSGLTRKTRTEITSKAKKKKALAKNQHSPSKLQTYKEPLAQQIADVILKNERKMCDFNRQQQVCSEKEIIIKLFRCDRVQPVDNCSREKETTTKKATPGKRKGERELVVEEIPEAKKSKVSDSNDSNANLLAPYENQQSVVERQLPLSTVENIGVSVVESQNDIDSNIVENRRPAVDNQEPLNITENTEESLVESKSQADSNINDIKAAKNIENISENHETTAKDSSLENLSDVNVVENRSYPTESPETEERENQHDNEPVESERVIIVNSSGDNTSVHEEKTVEDRDDRHEAIAIDTSESETNDVNNDDMVVEASTSTVVQDMESQSLLARRMVEEVINDWTVGDDDKTDNIDNTDVNEDLSTPEVIQIDDNEDLDVMLDVHQEAVSTETENDPSHNLIPSLCETAELNIIDISDSPQIQTVTSANVNVERAAENEERNNTEKETRESNSTSEVSEAEDVDDSNFESIDESSCAEIFPNDNCDDYESNVRQETITYYNSEDISMEVTCSPNSNRMNDVVMNLKDACDKITADLSGVNENSEDSPNHHEPELLYISDDSNDVGDEEEEGGEEEEEVMIIEPLIQLHEPEPQDEEPQQSQQSLLISNQLQQAVQGTPSISVIKASELRDEVLGPPVEYPIKPTGQQVVVYPQRQMLSTTLLPASIISGKPEEEPPMFTEDSIIQCPKCRCDFVGKTRLRRHWLTCGDAMFLNCPWCTTRVKQRRSLIYHINTQHLDRINKSDVVQVVERIVKHTREAAGVKIKPRTQTTLPDLLPTFSNPPMLELPAYIRVQCVVCNKMYEEIPATYKKTCDDCSSDLMTAICQLCRKQYMLSPKVALHVQGNCIFNGRIKCQECEFVASSRYNLQEHIIRRHIYVAPEDYEICRLGCGKRFRVHDALKKHERICAKEPNLTCRFCDYRTKHRSAMKMHVQQHIVHQKLTVDEAGNLQVFGREALRQHRAMNDSRSASDGEDRNLTTEQQVRGVIRVHCTRCSRTLRLTSNRSSCESCHLSFTFSCSRCPNLMSYESLHGARLHVIRQHCVKIHECPHCAEKFSYVYDLTRHASKCTAKALSCEFCNYTSNSEYKLRTHKRRVHMINSKELPTCKKCGKWFNRGDSLRRHEKDNCGVEPRLSCEHCQFKTKTKFSLLRHIQSQHAYIYDNFNFVCDRCNKFYTNMFAYEEHVKNCHALNMKN